MTRWLLLILLGAFALAASGCGEKSIDVASNDPLRDGAELFNARCSGCHTFDAAGAEGSAVRANSREYKDGPNFNQRKEQYDAVLYAIRNGGFSSGPMPQNIVVGKEAELVACFVAEYSGKDAKNPPSPGSGNAPTGSGEDNCRDKVTK